jgi:hypothetical protein
MAGVSDARRAHVVRRHKEGENMALRWGWMLAGGLPLVLIGGVPAGALAAQAEQNGQPPAQTEKATPETPAKSEQPATVTRPAGLVGTIVAVAPESQTIVADVALGKETLRLGAETTDETKILVGGKKASLDALKAGERVRISYHRTARGDVANSVVALQNSKG